MSDRRISGVVLEKCKPVQESRLALKRESSLINLSLSFSPIKITITVYGTSNKSSQNGKWKRVFETPYCLISLLKVGALRPGEVGGMAHPTQLSSITLMRSQSSQPLSNKMFLISHQLWRRFCYLQLKCNQIFFPLRNYTYFSESYHLQRHVTGNSHLPFSYLLSIAFFPSHFLSLTCVTPLSLPHGYIPGCRWGRQGSRSKSKE